MLDEQNIVGQSPPNQPPNNGGSGSGGKPPTIDRVIELLRSVGRKYVQKVAEQIKRIGEMNPSSVNRLAEMLAMNANLAEIKNDLMVATSQTMTYVDDLCNKALQDTYADKRFANAVNNQPVEENNLMYQRLQKYTQQIARQTKDKIQNLSNTTIESQTYQNAIDKAIIATSSGIGSYTEAMRDTIRSLGASGGIQVQYPSGAKRRLDSAVRQNIIDGTNQIAQHGAEMMGEELGYDAVEISAHSNSAPDHEPVQGRVFLNSEFDKMQSGKPFEDINGRKYKPFKRPISEWNCNHIAMPFSTQHSKPVYTTEQLDEMIKTNHDKVKIRDKEYTKYEITQMMRKTETSVRKYKSIAVSAMQSGDMKLRQQCQLHINDLGNWYSLIAKTSGLPLHKDRMRVEGFRKVKVQKVEQ